METVVLRLSHGFLPALGKARDCKNKSFRILVGIYCHSIPTCTLQSGYHGVTEVAKTANIAKMAERCMNCTRARPIPPRRNPMESRPGNTFSAQIEKPKRLMETQKRGVIF